MFLLAGASGLAAFIVVFGGLRRLTDERQRLRLDRLRE
jgi:putative ABC transport system permease protein